MVLNKWNSLLVGETDISHIIILKNIYLQTEVGLISKGIYFYESKNKDLDWVLNAYWINGAWAKIKK